MTKYQFCNDPDVQGMAAWMAQRFDSAPGWTHAYHHKQYQKDYKFNSLQCAFYQYKWKKENWKNTKKDLDVYRYNLQQALTNGDTNNIIAICKCILRWGGVANYNIDYINNRKSCIIQEFHHMMNILSMEKIPLEKDIFMISYNRYIYD